MTLPFSEARTTPENCFASANGLMNLSIFADLSDCAKPVEARDQTRVDAKIICFNLFMGTPRRTSTTACPGDLGQFCSIAAAVGNQIETRCSSWMRCYS